MSTQCIAEALNTPPPPPREYYYREWTRIGDGLPFWHYVRETWDMNKFSFDLAGVTIPGMEWDSRLETFVLFQTRDDTSATANISPLGMGYPYQGGFMARSSFPTRINHELEKRSRDINTFRFQNVKDLVTSGQCTKTN